MDTIDYPTVTFDYTKEDYAAAAQFQFLSGRPGPWFGALFSVAACSALFYFLRRDGASTTIALLITMLAIFVVGAFVVIVWKVLMPWFGGRAFAKHPLGHLRRSLSLRPEGLRFETARGETTLLWRDFIKWRTDRRSTLLFSAPRVCILIPNRLADLGFPLDELKAILAREIGPPRRWS